MATIVVFAHDPRDRARLHGALGLGHRLLDRDDWPSVRAALHRHAVHLVAFTSSPLDADPAPRLRWIHRHHPGVGLLLYAAGADGGRAAWRLGQLGVDDLLIEGVDHGRLDVRRAARRAMARALGRAVGSAVRGQVHPLLERGLVRAIAGATVPMTPQDLAEPEGVDVASLQRRLRALGLPPTGRILRWGLLVRAAAALDRDERTVEAIALELGYSTGAALARALRREIGLPPSTLRERGALRCTLESFIEREGGWTGATLVVE